LKDDDLQGLGLNELKQFEKTIEIGLDRVIEIKVHKLTSSGALLMHDLYQLNSTFTFRKSK